MTIKDLKDNNLILLEVISGSRAFGLETQASDTDIRGVYYMPKEAFFGLEYIPQVSNESNDIVYYEIGRYIELLIKNNPNILEVLATPADFIIYKHPVLDKIRPEDFLSKLCKDTFAGYAITQIKKARGLKKKILNPVEKERKSLLSFCYITQDYKSIPLLQWLSDNGYVQQYCGLVSIPHFKGLFGVYYNTDNKYGYKGIVQNEHSNEVSLSSIPGNQMPVAYMYCNKELYSAYCKEYKEYWDWVTKRNEDRYATNKEHGKQYDSKNMMHTIRLLQSVNNMFVHNTLNIRVDNRDELLAIKAGQIEYDDLLIMADGLVASTEINASRSNLPDFPDKDKAEQVLVSIREELYRY